MIHRHLDINYNIFHRPARVTAIPIIAIRGIGLLSRNSSRKGVIPLLTLLYVFRVPAHSISVSHIPVLHIAYNSSRFYCQTKKQTIRVPAFIQCITIAFPRYNECLTMSRL